MKRQGLGFGTFDQLVRRLEELSKQNGHGRDPFKERELELEAQARHEAPR